MQLPPANPAALRQFNLRVYGIWQNPQGQVLVSEEWLRGQHIIFKLPGGGVELGEGLLQALHREWYEETGLPVLAQQHYYTTDFFQQSAFNDAHQIISVYYLLRSVPNAELTKLDVQDDVIRYHWVPLADFRPERLSLPIDQHVARMVQQDVASGRWAELQAALWA